MRGWPAVLLVLAACGSSEKGPPPLRHLSLSYSYVIRPDDAPPHARQDINYTIKIVDAKTRQPIENGEGQIFFKNRDGAGNWDGFVYGPEVGTYHAKISFVTSGLWAMGIRFRRDSLHPLERIDWMQDVLDEKPSNVP